MNPGENCCRFNKLHNTFVLMAKWSECDGITSYSSLDIMPVWTVNSTVIPFLRKNKKSQTTFFSFCTVCNDDATFYIAAKSTLHERIYLLVLMTGCVSTFSKQRLINLMSLKMYFHDDCSFQKLYVTDAKNFKVKFGFN